MNKLTVILNGPIGSGKDHITNALLHHLKLTKSDPTYLQGSMELGSTC